MRIDFGPLRSGQTSLVELAAPLTKPDLASATEAMTQAFLERLAGCHDEDVTFEPVDPEAHDEYAADAAEVGLAWTLGHVIVHATASAEEAAFLAAELARGVEPHGRSRFETPWPSVTTIEACRARLRESRRLILATLDVWPAEPHLEVTYETRAGARWNAVARFLSGLAHSDAHLDQVAETVRQARAARGVVASPEVAGEPR